MITPRPCSFMTGSAAREPNMVPIRLTSRMRRCTSTGTSPIAPYAITAASFTQTSMRPSSDTARAASASTWSLSATSVGTATARAPSPRHCCAVSSSVGPPRAASTRFAPRSAKRTAAARPMPLEAPVRTTAAPDRSTPRVTA